MIEFLFIVGKIGGVVLGGVITLLFTLVLAGLLADGVRKVMEKLDEWFESRNRNLYDEYNALRRIKNERLRYAMSVAGIVVVTDNYVLDFGVDDMRFDEHHETLFQIWRDERGCE